MPAMLSLITAVMLVAAVVSVSVGLTVVLVRWLATPSHPRFVLTPAPATRVGVALRLLREGVAFESLLRADPLAWLLGWSMHVALALLALQHLRYVVSPWWSWVEWLAGIGHLASGLAVLSLVGLWLRRLLVPRVRFVSRASDHLWLAWLLILVVSGAALKYLAPVNVVAVKAFVLGALSLEHVTLPDSGLLLMHLWMAFALIALFPYSKLLHGVGVWINPTRAARGLQRSTVEHDD